MSTSLLLKDRHSRRFSDFVTFAFSYQNTGSKDIRAFTGVLVCSDFFDKEHIRITFTIDDLVIPAGQQVIDKSRVLELNEFKDSHNWLKTHTLQDMQVNFEIDAIMFTDGSKISKTD